MRILAIDPGRSTGWARFALSDGHLIEAGCSTEFPFRGLEIERAIIEMPFCYPDRASKGDHNDLMKLALRVGRYTERLESAGIEVQTVYPRDWKGQLDKAVHHGRELSMTDLRPAEKKILLDVIQPMAVKPREDVLDAFCLGRWWLREGRRKQPKTLAAGR